MSPGCILDLGAVTTCPHGGRLAPAAEHRRVLVDGRPALVIGDPFPVVGCPFVAPAPDGPQPRPCTDTVWSATATRVLVDGHPVVLSTSAGQCLTADGILQGPSTSVSVQPRVVAQ